MAGSCTTLNTGAKIPMVGLGTWQSKPGEVKSAVEAAIDVGYRHIDCAFIYQNESEVGDAKQSKIQQGVVKREDLFVTTKLWLTFFGPDKIKECFDKSRSLLKLDYVDLYLMHSPFAFQFTTDDDLFPKKDEQVLYDESIDYMAVWKQMEVLYRGGKTRAIGVSNFNVVQLGRVLKEGSIVPAVNQYESHPYLGQDELLKLCQSNGIVVTGYSPFGSPGRPNILAEDPCLFDDPVLKATAEKYGKSIAQVILRYQIQRGIVVIPKSVTPSRIVSNIQVFDFELSADDMAAIKKLDRSWRFFNLNFAASHKYYPFGNNYSMSE